MQFANFSIGLEQPTDNEVAQRFFEDGPVDLYDFHAHQDELEEAWAKEPFVLQAFWEAIYMDGPQVIPGWINLSVGQALTLIDEIEWCPSDAPFELVQDWVENSRSGDFPTHKDLHYMNPDRVINLSEVAGNNLHDQLITLTRRNNPSWLEVSDPDWEDEETLIRDAIDRWLQGSYEYGGWLVIDDDELL